MTKKRSRAASGRKLSANSRNAQALARARSLAAKKGWSTRRRNAAKRSRAARQGWETRRANEKSSRTRATRKSRGSVSTTRKRKSHPKRKSARHTPESASRSEFAVSADYRSRKASSAVTVQMSAIGPRNATLADAQAAATYKINRGRSPNGWQVRIINWRGAEWRGEPIEPDQKIADAWKTLSVPLALADIEVSPVGKGEA